MKKKLYSSIYKLWYLISHGVKLSGLIYRSKITGLSGNIVVRLNHLDQSSISINGKNNQIDSYAKLFDTKIRIKGNNNRLIIKKGVEISDTEIMIRGNNCEISIGENTAILGNCRIVCQGADNYIRIGKNTLFSRDINIWNSDTHRIKDQRGEIINHSRPIVIGEHVWIGRHANILKGVTIGDGAVVGMMALVTKDVPARTVVAGTPAKVVREEVTWSKDFVD